MRRPGPSGTHRGTGYAAAADPYDAAAAILVELIDSDEAPRGVIRELLIRHLDDDLRSAAPLLPAFRGRVPDA